MGLLGDIFTSPVIAEQVMSNHPVRGGAGYNKEREYNTMLERYNIPISQLPLAAIEEAILSAYFNGNVVNADSLILKEGLDVYQEMQDHDAHIFSVSDDLKGGAANTPYRIVPSTIGDPAAEKLALFVEKAFEAFDFTNNLKELAHGALIGRSVCEIVYKNKPMIFEGKKTKVPDRLERIPERNIVVDLSGRPRLLTRRNPMEGDALDEWKFITLKWGSGYFGDPMLKHCYAAYWYKRNSQRYMAKFLERWGDPAIIGFYNGNFADIVLNAIKDVRSSSYGVMPESTKEPLILQPDHDTNFVPCLEFFNDEISKVFLGGTRTMAASSASGSRAATETHKEGSDNRKELLAKSLCSVVNSQLIPAIVAYNFLPQKEYPKMVLGVLEEESPNEYMGRVVQLKNSGLQVKISKKQFHERSGFDAPDEALGDADALVISGSVGIH